MEVVSTDLTVANGCMMAGVNMEVVNMKGWWIQTILMMEVVNLDQSRRSLIEATMAYS